MQVSCVWFTFFHFISLSLIKMLARDDVYNIFGIAIS